MKALSDMIGVVLDTIGKVVSFASLAIAIVVLTEICSRLVFNVSLAWASDVASWLMCALIMLGGPWALSCGKFVRVDALYSKFSPRLRLWIDGVLGTIVLLMLCYVLIRHGYTFAERAFLSGERPNSANWPAPVWVFKALIPLGASLMILGWLRLMIDETLAYLHPEFARDDNDGGELHG